MRKFIGNLCLGFLVLLQLVSLFGRIALAKEAVPSAAKDSLPPAIYIATGPPGGYQYLTITYLGNLTKSKYGVVMTPIPGGSDLNMAKIVKGELFIGQAVNEAASAAYNGTSLAVTREEAYNNLRTVATTDEQPFLFTVRRNSGINNPADLKGKGLVARYSTCMYAFDITKYVLEGYGVNPKSVKIITATTYADGYTSFKDHTTDSFVSTFPNPHHFLEELCKDYNAKVFGIERKDVRRRVIQNMPAMIEAVIPKGMYAGQTEDIHTIAVNNAWLCNKKTPDRIVEIFLDEFYNPKNKEQLLKIHPILAQYTLEKAVTNAQVPFHEAAVKYFKKAGVWTAEAEKRQQALLKLGSQVK